MILNGWKEIAAYVNSSVRTVQRWEKEGMPIMRPVPASRGSVIAYSDQLDAWLGRSRDRSQSVAANANRESQPSGNFYEDLVRARALAQKLVQTTVEMRDRTNSLKAQITQLRENMHRIKLAANQHKDDRLISANPAPAKVGFAPVRRSA
jgi:phage terminase Nu1 subunit (DNA packaging protein)